MAWNVPNGAQTVTDGSGVTWYKTQGGNWRNTQSGAVSSSQPAAGATTAATSAQRQVSTPAGVASTTGPINLDEWSANLQDQVLKGWITQAQADAEMARARAENERQASYTAGNIQNPVDTGSISAAFGDEAAGNAAGADQLYRDIMPLNLVDVSLTKDQEYAQGQAREASERAETMFNPAMESAANAAAKASQVDPNQQRALDEFWTQYQNAGQFDPRMEQYLSELRSRADQGLMRPELTAMREEGMGGINDQMQGAMRQLAIRGGVNGVQGGAAGIGNEAIVRDALRSRGDLERKILLENIAYQDAALRDWGTGVGNMDAERFKRTQDTLANYASYGNKMNNDLMSNWNNANKTWGDITNQASTAMTNASRSYWDVADAASNSLDAKNAFNISQKEKYGSGRLGAIAGGASWWSSEDARKTQERLWEEYINKMSEVGAMGEFPGEGGYGGSNAILWQTGGQPASMTFNEQHPGGEGRAKGGYGNR